MKKGIKLLTKPTAQPKAEKSMSVGYATFVLHFAQYDLSGRNVCPWAGLCTLDCLGKEGRGGINAGTMDDIRARNTNKIQLARLRRTDWFFSDRPAFLVRLRREIRNARKWAEKRGLRLAMRLNGTSDVVWERIDPTLFVEFADVVFYDYTKAPFIVRDELPANYSLTFSFGGDNWHNFGESLANGRNASVVFRVKRNGALPSTFAGLPVIDGDKTDARFLDRSGVIVGLRAKGRSIKSTSKFIVSTGRILPVLA